jgi:hypothetical protein
VYNIASGKQNPIGEIHMKVSQLVTLAQEFIEKYGDKDILVHNYDGLFEEPNSLSSHRSKYCVFQKTNTTIDRGGEVTHGNWSPKLANKMDDEDYYKMVEKAQDIASIDAALNRARACEASRDCISGCVKDMTNEDWKEWVHWCGATGWVD